MKKFLTCAGTLSLLFLPAVGCATYGDGATTTDANAVDLAGKPLAITAIDQTATRDGVTSHVRVGDHVYVVTATAAPGAEPRITCERDDRAEALAVSLHGSEILIDSQSGASANSTKAKGPRGDATSLDRLRARAREAPAVASLTSTLTSTLPVTDHVVHAWKQAGLGGRFAELLEASSEALADWKPITRSNEMSIQAVPSCSNTTSCSAGNGSICDCSTPCDVCISSANACSCSKRSCICEL